MPRFEKAHDVRSFHPGQIMSASAASIGLLGLCLAAVLMERLQSTTHMVVAALILNACGILACTLGLLLDRPAVWSPIMLLMGLSDINPFIYNTSGVCGESQQLIRLSDPLYTWCSQHVGSSSRRRAARCGRHASCLSAARASAQYSLQCTRLESVVVVPIKDRVLPLVLRFTLGWRRSPAASSTACIRCISGRF